MLVIVDSPEFTHPVAQARRAAAPGPADHRLCLADASGPGGPGARRKMARYIDHVLALLPFEPEAHRRLGGPPCTYVGHPLIERLPELRPAPANAAIWGRARRFWSCPGAGRRRSRG